MNRQERKERQEKQNGTRIKADTAEERRLKQRKDFAESVLRIAGEPRLPGTLSQYSTRPNTTQQKKKTPKNTA